MLKTSYKCHTHKNMIKYNTKRTWRGKEKVFYFCEISKSKEREKKLPKRSINLIKMQTSFWAHSHPHDTMRIFMMAFLFGHENKLISNLPSTYWIRAHHVIVILHTLNFCVISCVHLSSISFMLNGRIVRNHRRYLIISHGKSGNSKIILS